MWRELARVNGGVVLVVKRPTNNVWATTVYETLNAQTAIVTLPQCNWIGGNFLDLKVIGKRCRKFGAAFVIDSTQATDAYPMDVQKLQPNFIACPSFKWLLTPIIFSPYRQSGTPFGIA